MRQTRFFQFLTVIGTALFFISTLLFFKSELIAQNTYLGPTSRGQGNSKLIRVEISVNDDPKLGGVEINDVRFNNTSIPLKPRDISGFRGQGSFQLPPGKYKLNWSVNRDKSAWPRSVSHEELVTLDPRDLWVQILVVGDEVSIR